jgi:hypothetical protein
MFKDRIKELRRVQAKQLVPNPKNWRTHPAKQRKALQGILNEIGYADALLARELPDGSLQLLDGHLRAETTPNQAVPVLILDLDDNEADKFLAVFDPLTNLAGTNQPFLDGLIAAIETENEAVQTLLQSLSGTDNLDALRSVSVPELFQLVITCEDESGQQTLYEEFTKRELPCKIVNL